MFCLLLPAALPILRRALLRNGLAASLGGRFYVENQPGAGGIAAARTVISSPPDGHTLALLSNGTAISVSLFSNLPYDPLKDFVPISSLGFFDFIFATNSDSEFKTLADFISAAKATPGALNVGTINVGSTQNLSAELLKTAADVDFVIIPYRGTPDLLVSTMQGNLALMIDSYSSMKGNLADKKIRALASSGPVRSESTPDIPTLQEGGVANYDVVSWNALFAPAGTPPEIVKTLNQALQEILAEMDVKKRLLELGIEARGEHARRDIRQTEVRYRKVAKGDREGRYSETIGPHEPQTARILRAGGRSAPAMVTRCSQSGALQHRRAPVSW